MQASPGSDLNLKEAIASFLHELADVRLASGHTVAAYRRDLCCFAEHCGEGSRLNHITRIQVQDWLVHGHASGLAASTLARRLSALSSFLMRQFRPDNARPMLQPAFARPNNRNACRVPCHRNRLRL
ncbi:MAG: site-specific integrase [Mariprofundus sp.]